MLSWPRPPPGLPMGAGCITTSGVLAKAGAGAVAHVELADEAVLAVERPEGWWVCGGISETESTWLLSPAAVPNGWDWSRCMGDLPWRLGRAKFVLPLPPYVVPRIANSAWFELMGSSWPWHSAQPFGAKVDETARISPMKGSDIRNAPQF